MITAERQNNNNIALQNSLPIFGSTSCLTCNVWTGAFWTGLTTIVCKTTLFFENWLGAISIS